MKEKRMCERARVKLMILRKSGVELLGCYILTNNKQGESNFRKLFSNYAYMQKQKKKHKKIEKKKMKKKPWLGDLAGRRTSHQLVSIVLSGLFIILSAADGNLSMNSACRQSGTRSRFYARTLFFWRPVTTHTHTCVELFELLKWSFWMGTMANDDNKWMDSFFIQTLCIR